MKAVLLALAILSLCALGTAQKKKSARTRGGPEVEMLDTRVVRRTDGTITVDGRVRVTANKSIHGLVVIFNFLTSEGGVVTSQKAPVENAVMQPGEEAAYHGVTPDPPRAVRYLVAATDDDDRELRVAGAGPHPIE